MEDQLSFDKDHQGFKNKKNFSFMKDQLSFDKDHQGFKNKKILVL